MSTSDEFITYETPTTILNTAEVIARERVKHEYNRFGYDRKTRIEKIASGFIGELMFMHFLKERGIPALFFMVVGDFDEGYDVRAGALTIDVKTTTFEGRGRGLSSSLSIIENRFHLYIADDAGQARKAGSDIYVQGFVVDDDICVLTGYAWGVPQQVSANPENVFQARELRVSELEPLETLADLPQMQPLCARCGEPLEPRTRMVYRRGRNEQVVCTDSVPELMADTYRQHDELRCTNCS